MANGWRTESIKNAIAMIQSGDMLLPAIQRKYVWSEQQIVALMDSIMSGYPIGTFLIWKIKVEDIRAHEYTFYRFIENYHEKEHAVNERINLIARDCKDVIWGVLDGQQRLNSLLIATVGSYAAKLPRKRWENPEAFPKKEMYFNLLSQGDISEEDESSLRYEFRFFEKHQIDDPNTLWLKVSDVFGLEKGQIYDYCFDSFGERYSANTIGRVIAPNLIALYDALVSSELISYFQVETEDMDQVLDIFVRTNSGGTILSKSDLLFSTIVSTWQDAREQIDGLIKEIADRGFRIDSDFVVKNALAVLDLKTNLKVSNLNASRVCQIRDGWYAIREAVITVFDFLRSRGYDHSRVTSYNSLIPMVYAVFKGVKMDGLSKREFAKYLVIAQVKQLFGASSTTAISRTIDALRNKTEDGYVLKDEHFAMEQLQNVNMPTGSYRLTEQDLDDLFDIEKGPYALMILSRLYPEIRMDRVVFHMDHMHPWSAFEDKNLELKDITTAKCEEWKRKRNTLANLQLLEGSENESKNDSSLVEWLSKDDNAKRVRYLPEGISLEIDNFDEFMEKREELMKAKLKESLAYGRSDGVQIWE